MSKTVEFRSDFKCDLVQFTGSDHVIANAARVSTGNTTSDTTRDAGLINYLMKHRHGSPFEHNSMTFRIEAPQFVHWEWVRHRVGWSYNLESARYSELEGVFYVPSRYRPLVQSGSSAHPMLTEGDFGQYAQVVRATYDVCEAAYDAYRGMLKRGIAREVARSVLPTSVYYSAYVTCNARSMMAFLSLRTDEPESAFPSKPQWEIDQCARQLEETFFQHFPLTHNAFVENRRVAP